MMDVGRMRRTRDGGARVVGGARPGDKEQERVTTRDNGAKILDRYSEAKE